MADDVDVLSSIHRIHTVASSSANMKHETERGEKEPSFRSGVLWGVLRGCGLDQTTVFESKNLEPSQVSHRTSYLNYLVDMNTAEKFRNAIPASVAGIVD
jgi:hypothetical protein